MHPQSPVRQDGQRGAARGAAEVQKSNAGRCAEIHGPEWEAVHFTVSVGQSRPPIVPSCARALLQFGLQNRAWVTSRPGEPRCRLPLGGEISGSAIGQASGMFPRVIKAFGVPVSPRWSMPILRGAS